jgi:hypothetical protein
MQEAVGVGASSPRPRVVVEGDFGSGKTHLLRAALLKQERSVVWVELSGLHARTAWAGWDGLHATLLQGPLDAWATAIGMVSTRQIDAALQHTTLKDVEDVRKALRDLLGPRSISGQPSPAQLDARAWFTASRTLTASAARKAGFSALAVEVLSPSRHAELLDVLARLAWDRDKERLGESAPRPVLVIDESNSFANLRQGSAVSGLKDWTRALVDPDRSALGVIFGVVTPKHSFGAEHPIFRTDVRSRIPTHIVLPSLGDLDQTRQFLDALWAKVSRLQAVRPFRLKDDALRWLHQHLGSLRIHYLGIRSESLAADPSRRDLLRVLQIAGSAAAEEGIELITEADLQRWFLAS